jgi:hypothetical protein
MNIIEKLNIEITTVSRLRSKSEIYKYLDTLLSESEDDTFKCYIMLVKAYYFEFFGDDIYARDTYMNMLNNVNVEEIRNYAEVSLKYLDGKYDDVVHMVNLDRIKYDLPTSHHHYIQSLFYSGKYIDCIKESIILIPKSIEYLTLIYIGLSLINLNFPDLGIDFLRCSYIKNKNMTVAKIYLNELRKHHNFLKCSMILIKDSQIDDVSNSNLIEKCNYLISQFTQS